MYSQAGRAGKCERLPGIVTMEICPVRGMPGGTCQERANGCRGRAVQTGGRAGSCAKSTWLAAGSPSAAPIVGRYP